jgi:hypothetical protein
VFLAKLCKDMKKQYDQAHISLVEKAKLYEK